MPPRYYNHVSHDDLVRATRALVKFSLDHQSDVRLFADVLAYLEADDFKAAIKMLRSNPPGPFSWNDWFPPVAFEHENEDYVWVVWDSLVERWYRLMRTAAGERG